MKRALITIALLAVVAVAGIYFVQEAQYASARADASAARRASMRETVAADRATQTAQAGARESTATPAPTSTNTPTPGATETPQPTGTNTPILPAPTADPAEVLRLSRLLAYNDYSASGYGEEFLAFSDSEEAELVAIYHDLFIEVAAFCELEHDYMFWIMQRRANALERRGLSPWLGKLRERVSGAGWRYSWMHLIAHNSMTRGYIEKDVIGERLGRSSSRGERCENRINRD